MSSICCTLESLMNVNTSATVGPVRYDRSKIPILSYRVRLYLKPSLGVDSPFKPISVQSLRPHQNEFTSFIYPIITGLGSKPADCPFLNYCTYWITIIRYTLRYYLRSGISTVPFISFLIKVVVKSLGVPRNKICRRF